MNDSSRQPVDCNGTPVGVGARVRVLSLSGDWYDSLPPDERERIDSMIGEVFEVDEIDEYGHPWVSKDWSGDDESSFHSHSIALEPSEFVCVDPAG